MKLTVRRGKLVMKGTFELIHGFNDEIEVYQKFLVLNLIFLKNSLKTLGESGSFQVSRE